MNVRSHEAGGSASVSSQTAPAAAEAAAGAHFPGEWSIRCRCGAPAIAAAPGDEPEIAPGGIVISRGKPTLGWCLDHWPTMRGFQADLFAERQQAGALQ